MTDENNVLPDGFDGVFRFTNWTNVDFKAKWNNVEYTFPANKTSPLVIPGETPEGVQSIRKKFARELAEQAFYATDKFHHLNDVGPGQVPALYTDSDLVPFIQRCLEPLPIAPATTRVIKEDVERVFSTDARGKKRTKVLEPDDSLVGDGTVVA